MKLTSGIPGRAAVWHLADIPIAQRERLYGHGSYKPLVPVVAGEFVTVTFQFEVGQTEIPTGGRLRIAWRWPFDWAELQTGSPQDDGYMTVSTFSGSGGRLSSITGEAVYHHLGDLDPWNHHIDIEVTAGKLIAGDRVELVCGDRSGGGRGWRAPTFVAKTAKFLMLINPDHSDRWLRLPDAPGFPLVPGPPVRLVAITPAETVVNEDCRVLVRAEDCWGNPTPLFTDTLQLSVLSATESVKHIKISDMVTVSAAPAAYRFTVRLTRAGSYRLVAAVPDTPLKAESNPLRVHATRPPLQLFWGDLHSGQTDIGCGAGSLAEHYTYARDVAGLQFTSQQANDHYLTLVDWQHVREVTPTFDEPGRFVAFLGCEWSSPTENGGDRNVIYQHDEPRLRRSGRFFTETEPDPEPDRPTATEFHAAMQHEAVLINMHVGGRPTNLDYHLPQIEPLAEIHSTHGTSEWFVKDALQRGYKIGLTAGTDGVMTRPGACTPGSRVVRNVRNGLTAVYATELTQAALWTAFQARRCYATDGERIRLWVEVDGQPMGSEIETNGSPLISITVEGTAPLERIELLRGTSVLCRWQIALADEEADGKIQVLWGGAATRGTARAQRAKWDGTLHAVDGYFSDVQPVGFQSCQDRVQLDDPAQISWQSVTAGNDAGFTATLHGDESTVYHFSAGPCNFTFTLNQVKRAPLVVDAGGVGRYVSIGPAPAENSPRQIELSYRDTQPLTGEWPYWVRVVQIDQAKAWSSPVYVTHSG